MIKHPLIPISAFLLLMLTACQSTPEEPAAMPPASEPDIAAATEPSEPPPPTPTPAPDSDYTLKIGEYRTSFEELESGTLDKSKPVIVIMNPAVEYARAVEILTRVSDLGYLVEFQASP